MYAAIGIVILIVMVFGGFALTGGALAPVMHALPHEMLIIGGAALGALVTGNSLHGLKAIGGAFGKVFKGPKHTKQDHIDAIILVTRLMKLLKSEGPVALESHVTDPASSAIFAEFPRLLANKALVALIADTLTLIVVSSGTLEVHAVEEVMDNAMKTHFHELHEPQHALQGQCGRFRLLDTRSRLGDPQLHELSAKLVQIPGEGGVGRDLAKRADRDRVANAPAVYHGASFVIRPDGPRDLKFLAGKKVGVLPGTRTSTGERPGRSAAGKVRATVVPGTVVAVAALESVMSRPLMARMVAPAGMPVPVTVWPTASAGLAVDRVTTSLPLVVVAGNVRRL